MMDERIPAEAGARELGASVQRALDEVRFRNARRVALLRVGIRVTVLVLFGAAWLQGSSTIGIAPALGAVVSAAHIAVGVGILLWLRRHATVLAIGIRSCPDRITIHP